MADNPLPPYAPTDWTRFDLPAIWEQMRPENDRLTRAQAGTWNRTYDLLDAHRATLERLSDDLAKIWPPLPNSASATFHARLGILIASVASTSHDASSNAIAVSSIADTLMDARGKVQQLHQQTTTQPYDVAKVNKNAAVVMTEADKATYDYATLLRKPEIADDFSSIGAASTAPDGHVAGPEVSTTTPADNRGAAAAASSWSGGTASQSGTGPALTGAPSPLVPQIGSANRPGAPAPAASGPGAHDWPPGVLGVPGGSLKSTPPGNSGTGSTWERSARTTQRQANASDNTERARTTSTARPPGGTDATGSGVAERETAGHGMQNPGMLGGGAGRSQRRRRSTGPAYTEWSVDKGVPGILKPPPEPTDFEPGPGVWGMHT